MARVTISDTITKALKHLLVELQKLRYFEVMTKFLISELENPTQA